jgi:hypothetical protein
LRALRLRMFVRFLTIVAGSKRAHGAGHTAAVESESGHACASEGASRPRSRGIQRKVQRFFAIPSREDGGRQQDNPDACLVRVFPYVVVETARCGPMRRTSTPASPKARSDSVPAVIVT